MVALNCGYSLEASAEHKGRTSVQMHTENVELDSNEVIIMYDVSEESNEMSVTMHNVSRRMLTLTQTNLSYVSVDGRSDRSLFTVSNTISISFSI